MPVKGDANHGAPDSVLDFRIFSDVFPEWLLCRADLAAMNRLHAWLMILTLILTCVANAADDRNSVPDDLAPTEVLGIAEQVLARLTTDASEQSE